MIKLDNDYGTVYAKEKQVFTTKGLIPSMPGKPRVIQVIKNFLHLYTCMAVAVVGNKFPDQVDQH